MRGTLKLWAQITLVCAMVVVMLGATDNSSRFNDLGHRMICVCGCNEILLECNHVGCPDSDRMIQELRAQLSQGKSDTQIFNWFAAKYGPTVLAAPMQGGFDTVAWIAPFAVFLLATLGTALLVRKWRLRTVEMPLPPETPGYDAIRDRIRKETEFK
ncbi:MAG: cytochrome c-type biogenesis protein [Acidobacteriaceae bacterium]